MVRTGLEVLLNKIPESLSGKRVGVLCHAPSITREYEHIIDVLIQVNDLSLTAVFGPQHGIFGQTQDNMIEWEGSLHPRYNIPVYSLYGENRKPQKEMLNKIDALLIDIQDVGARLYTYVWTMKLCMEACMEAGIPVWVLDRPNPIAPLRYDGPVLKEEYFTFVGGASIPLCHRMTPAEIAVWLREKYMPGCDLKTISMQGWNRKMMYDDTALPWVLPSPNMPSQATAAVYPGMVLLEAMNISEGRGTTIPFELFGAPFLNTIDMLKILNERKIPGCRFRMHDFIPTFNKYQGQTCRGIQVHVTDPLVYRPVQTALEIIESAITTTGPGITRFNDPPYEYEYKLMPFDILSGDDIMRKTLLSGGYLKKETERWESEAEAFRREFRETALYGDC